MPSLRAFGDCSLGEATRHLSGVHTIQMDPLLDVELVIVDDNCVEGRWWKSESWDHSMNDMERTPRRVRGTVSPSTTSRIALF